MTSEPINDITSTNDSLNESAGASVSVTVSGGDLSSPDGDGGTETAVSVGYDTVYAAVFDALTDVSEASQTVTDGQTVNGTALSYFEGILANRLLPTDYVVYVGRPYTWWNGSSQRTAYEYCMAYGDLTLSDGHFSGTGTVCTLRTSGDVSVSYARNQDISLTAPPYYSRSNLGDYSGIYSYDTSGFLLVLGLTLGGLVWFMKKLLRAEY